jgi:hypothetical protein
VIDTTSIQQGLVQMGEKTARQMSSRLRRSAFERGWPVAVARHLSVRHADAEFDVVYPSQLKDSVESLEYGTQSVPPNAVIRQFRNRHGVRTDL